MEEIKLLCSKEVQAMTRLSVVSIWRLTNEGKFPQPDMRPLGTKKFWKQSTIQNWLNEQCNKAA